MNTQKIVAWLQARDAKRFQGDMAASAAAVDSVGAAGKRASAGLASVSKKGSAAIKAIKGAMLPLAAGLGGVAFAAVKYESAFAGVRKTVDATEPEFAKMSHGLRNMSKEIPTSASDLAGIAEQAGQLGVSKDHILSFTKTIAEMGDATNLSGDAAGNALARIANITGMSEKDFGRLGSVIVDLGNNSAATESDITEMGLRLAGAGNQVGLSQADIMGFSAALASTGVRAEAGGTAFSQTFLKMNSAVLGGGKNLQQYAKVAGMSSKEFATAFKKNAATAVVDFTDGLGKIKKKGGDVSGTLKGLGLGGMRVQDALMRTAGAGDKMRKSLGRASDAWKKGTALDEEAEKRYKTTAAQLKILKNNFMDMAISIGSKLLPVINDLIPVLKKLAPYILAAVAAYAAFKAAMAVQAVFAFVGAIQAAGGAFAVLNAIIMANPIGAAVLLIIAIGAAFVLAYKKIGWFKKGVDAVFGFIKKHWPLILSILIGPVGAAVLYIIRHWDEVKSAASGLVSWVKKAFTTMVDFFSKVPGKIASVASGMFDGIKNAFKSAINWVIGAWNSLHFKIPGFDPPGPGPKFGGFTLEVPQIPTLASGGVVSNHGSAIVGDAGPEGLSVRNGRAYVTPLPAFATARAGTSTVGSGRGTVVIPVSIGRRQVAEVVAEVAADDLARR